MWVSVPWSAELRGKEPASSHMRSSVLHSEIPGSSTCCSPLKPRALSCKWMWKWWAELGSPASLQACSSCYLAVGWWCPPWAGGHVVAGATGSMEGADPRCWGPGSPVPASAARLGPMARWSWWDCGSAAEGMLRGVVLSLLVSAEHLRSNGKIFKLTAPWLKVRVLKSAVILKMGV